MKMKEINRKKGLNLQKNHFILFTNMKKGMKTIIALATQETGMGLLAMSITVFVRMTKHF